MTTSVPQHETVDKTNSSKAHHFLEHFFDEGREGYSRQAYLFPESRVGPIHAETFVEDDRSVVKVVFLDADPEQAVDIRVVDGVLCIAPGMPGERRGEARNTDLAVERPAPVAPGLPFPCLPTEIDVKASFDDGVLSIRFPTAVRP